MDLFLFQGDIIEYINNVRVLSFKHAGKQLKNSVESAELRVKRHKNRFSLVESEEFATQEHQLDLEVVSVCIQYLNE